MQALIGRRRRQILAHSCLYYRFNTSIISDYTFDAWCNELVELQRNYPVDAVQAVYHEHFADFDGSSGFDLPTHLPEVVGVARRLIKQKRGD